MALETAHPFVTARTAKPTKKHRAAIWENMLGTVYADNGSETRYFGYDWPSAMEFAGVTAGCDPRIAKWGGFSLRGRPSDPRKGQRVLYVLR